MSEIHIDHEAAKVLANKFIECEKMCEGLVHNGFKSESILSRAYLDLHAQLAAERARVEALAGLVKWTQDHYAYKHPSWDLSLAKEKLTAILNGESEGA